MLISASRALLIAGIFIACLALALAIGLTLAHLGYLGTCQDGSCELVAVIYVMPLGGLALYAIALACFSLIAIRKRRRANG